MNSTELMNLFMEAQSKDNSIERFLFLHSKNKEYKKSDFYKKTKINIFKAYVMVVTDNGITLLNRVTQLSTPTKLGTFIQDTIENIESSAIEEFIDKIVEAFNVNEMLGATQEIKEQINNLIK